MFIILLTALYTVEFQKRGFPHAHILLFLHQDNNHIITADIDRIIFDEITNRDIYPRLFELWVLWWCMVHLALKIELSMHGRW